MRFAIFMRLSWGSPMTDAQPIEPRGPISVTVRPPGSKSITNRALLIAALADGASVLEAPLRSDDTIAMRSGLEALGMRKTKVKIGDETQNN